MILKRFILIKYVYRLGRHHPAAQGGLPENNLVAGVQRPLVGGHLGRRGAHPADSQHRHVDHVHTQHTRSPGTPLRPHGPRALPHRRQVLQQLPGQEKFVL